MCWWFANVEDAANHSLVSVVLNDPIMVLWFDCGQLLPIVWVEVGANLFQCHAVAVYVRHLPFGVLWVMSIGLVALWICLLEKLISDEAMLGHD